MKCHQQCPETVSRHSRRKSMTSQCQGFHSQSELSPPVHQVGESDTDSVEFRALQEPVMGLRVRTLSPSNDPMILPTQYWTKFQSLEPPERVSPVWTGWI